MEIKKLLFVTGFHNLWFDALQSLLDLKRAALNHVVFLNVIERDKVALHRGAGYQKEEEIKLREMANIRFIDWAETLFEQGMEVGVYIVVGALAQQVISAARKEEVDLIVLGRQKKGKLEQLIAGSDVSEILHRTGKPVLVYKYVTPESPAVEKPFARPLLAVDGSAAARQAVACLTPLKGIVEEVNLVHVADVKSLKGTSAMAVQKTRKQSRDKLEALCELLEAAGLKAKAHVYVGETVTELEKAARECQATMIITGTFATSTWASRWKGSTPEALADKSAFPTLLLPPA